MTRRLDDWQSLAADIRRFCAAHANPTIAAKWARYFTEGYDAWGIDTKSEEWAKKKEVWGAEADALAIPALIELGARLFKDGKYEEGGVGIQLLARQKEKMTAANVVALERWFVAGIGNWAHTDVLCGEVLSPIIKSGQIDLEILAPWRDAPRKYQQRAVPVAMLGLVGKEGQKPEPLLAFVEPLMGIDDRFVGQGVGWLLRETWKKWPKPVEAFLKTFKDTAPRVIIQYATEKMAPEQKAKYKRAAGAGRRKA